MTTDRLSLEDFPDEIFLEICKYFSIFELYSTFRNLNIRINHLLRSVHGLSLTICKPADLNQPAVLYFIPQIHHLIVQHSQSVPFGRFLSLRSIVSMFPSDEQLLDIQPNHLPNLTRLNLGFIGIWDCEISSQLCEQIFSNRFPKLRSCSLWPPALESDFRSNETTALTQIQLKEGNLDDLRIVLESSPNLKYLQMLVSIYAKRSERLTSHTNVRRVDVSFIPYDLDWLEKLDQFLLFVPNTKRLTIKICLLQIDFERLARILRQRVPRLTHFKCEIHALDIAIKLRRLQQYHPLFQMIDFEDIDEDDMCHCEGFKLCLFGFKKD